MKRHIARLIVFLFLIGSGFSEAVDLHIEKELQKSLGNDKVFIKKAKDKKEKGQHIKEEIAQLTGKVKDVKTAHLLILDKFRSREEELKSLGQKAQARHREMMEGYERSLDEYINLVEGIPEDGEDLGNVIDKLDVLTDSILYEKKIPLFGSLPYRNLNYPGKEPSTGPLIIPAYKGGNGEVGPKDLESTEEAPVSEEISSFAKSLKWDPVLIYEYVKNNIETEWYWGCMKGAEETLRQKSGNDCDQATLLTALLRASGFPSRYVRGTIEFFPGIDQAKNLTGIDDPWKIAEFFRKAGIPFKPVISGGGISNFRIEHIWVESYIPYANYRGTVLDEHGKRWLGLDTSIKVKGYEYNDAMDIFGQPAISSWLPGMREEYLSTVQVQTPFEYLKARLPELSGQQLTMESFKLSRSLMPEMLNILPASLQFHQRAITNEYTEIPDELKHEVRFTAVGAIHELPLLEITMDTFKLSNKQIALTYEPETVEDQEIINYFGGLDNTPAYLVRLRPVLTVDGERKVVGLDGLPMGLYYDLTIELISPNGTEKVTSTHIIGNLSIIGIVARRAVEITPSNFPLPQEGETSVTSPSEGGGEKDAEDVLYEEAINYIDRWNRAEEELASLLHLTITRPIPTVTTIGGVIDVTYLLNMPHGFEWKGVFVDANQRALEAVQSSKFEVQSEKQKLFMQLSALEGSVLEHKIFEDDWQVDSISTAKIFQIVGAINESPSVIATIDKTTIDSILPSLDLDDAIKNDISNAVNQNLAVRIPQADDLPLTTVSYKDWTGIGYIKENPETGEAGYMLSGMIAGGMTAASPGKWKSQNLASILGKPYTRSTSSTTSIAGYITFPYNGSTISVAAVDVEGVVSDPSATVKVSGVKAEVFSDGRFIAYGVELNEGANQIIMTAQTVYGGSVSHAISVTNTPAVTDPISVTITYPVEGTNLYKPFTLVKGTVITDAAEIWIKVNGILAEVHEGEFTANGVNLMDGDNTIIVNALDSNGAVGRAEKKVSAETTGAYITLSANITSGISPLITYFAVSTEIPNPISSYQMDFEGDGVIDYTGVAFDDISHAYTTEGLYYPTITILDDQGNIYADTIAITVINKTEIDALLKTKWEGMKEALANGTVAQAVQYIATGQIKMYEYNFTLMAQHLPEIVQEMGAIELVALHNNFAEYEMIAVQDEISASYYVVFIRDSNGIWKIYFF
jgi:hypothetical protein